MNTHIPKEQLDCKGMQCPAPILHIARAARKIGGTPALLEVTADDHDFPSDVEAWARSTGAEILLMQSEGGVSTALLGLNGASAPAPVLHAAPLQQAPAAPAPAAPVSQAPARRAAPKRPLSLVAPPDEAATDPGPEHIADLRGVSDSTALLQLSGLVLASPATPIVVLASSPSIIGRLHAWAAATGAVVGEIEVLADYVRLSVRGSAALEAELERLPAAPQPAAPAARAKGGLSMPEASTLAPPEPATCCLLVVHNDFEALMAAMMIANASAAQGMQTQIFFSFWGVNLLRAQTPAVAGPKPSFLQRMMKWMMPAGPERQPLGQMHFGGVGKGMMTHLMRKNNVLSLGQLMDAAAEQEVRFIACTMSMGLMGIAKEDLQQRENLEYGGVTSFVEAAAGAKLSMIF